MNEEPRQTPPEETCYGALIVQVTTARGAIPLENATVDVFPYDPDSPEPEGDLIASLRTDRSGNTPVIRLPAPTCSGSDSPGGPRPFSLYRASIRKIGYYDQSYSGIPIYEGITVIQPAILIPMAENGSAYPPPSRDFENTVNGPARESE